MLRKPEMASDNIHDIDLGKELVFTFSRSGGPGGQHVKKVSTRVELRFHVMNSALLTQDQKELIAERLANRINAEGDLIVVAQSERSQLKNKEKAIERFYSLISKALTPVKKRKPSKPSRASKEKRLKEKKKISEKKRYRSDENLPQE